MFLCWDSLPIRGKTAILCAQTIVHVEENIRICSHWILLLQMSTAWVLIPKDHIFVQMSTAWVLIPKDHIFVQLIS